MKFKKIIVALDSKNLSKTIKLVEILKKDVYKDETIKLEDVELNLPKEVIEARDYQYNLIELK